MKAIEIIDRHDFKIAAKRLRVMFVLYHIDISHSESLEVLSRILGYKDWNTASADLPDDALETEGEHEARIQGLSRTGDE